MQPSQLPTQLKPCITHNPLTPPIPINMINTPRPDRTGSHTSHNHPRSAHRNVMEVLVCQSIPPTDKHTRSSQNISQVFPRVPRPSRTKRKQSFRQLNARKGAPALPNVLYQHQRHQLSFRFPRPPRCSRQFNSQWSGHFRIFLDKP
jgi:hypothetical protein